MKRGKIKEIKGCATKEGCPHAFLLLFQDKMQSRKGAFWINSSFNDSVEHVEK